MRNLLNFLYSSDELKIGIGKIIKRHKGGCVIFSLSIVLNKSPEEIAKEVNKPLDYWFKEREIFDLEKILPVKVETYDRERVIESLKNKKSLIFCLNNHSFVCYGYSRNKELTFYIYDVNGKSRKEKEKNLQNAYVIRLV